MSSTSILDNPFVQCEISERLGGPPIACTLEELADSIGIRTAEHVVRALTPVIRRGGGAAGGWLDSAQAAEYLGLHPVTTRKLAASGAVDSFQDAPGGPRYFRPADLDAWRVRN